MREERRETGEKGCHSRLHFILGLFSSTRNGSLQFKGKVILKDCIITDGDSKGKRIMFFFPNHMFIFFAILSYYYFVLGQRKVNVTLIFLSDFAADVKNAFQLSNLQKSGSKDVWVTNSPKEKEIWTEEITKAIETMHTQDSAR